ncbi:helix-turn-helix domain-containing protein [Elizabethkingia meningoseptica]|uniref:helix-turn-helix domain-containing protein n=1 Tax=Elizabethkingia meningoseptica TaxID=238 RepID=UPI0023AE9A56|nr:helix-turn-helix domain-containing protein [Elizabethkingia meningoseptica]MDE5430350.1 helix-turn-helix domain-containing protein [Elizabethkingia meningoseptica]MDE5437295.1 helix-turn-helix domain-containing protein [Elizabethkingia meningoseptica]MDE5510397.1 helix-turn-helix domain-containing protein [Elizabethkingia meningoseptica]MDE5514196.1 helix-turn-helix domain-containing protein [Elizabethkingia meningoseptica]MDE5524843.1 helix-turn-helix domain-containing protein [Elizabethki
MSALKAIREQKNLTQEELSERSKISVRTIQRIEAGTEPKGHTLRALAKALETDEQALLNKPAEEHVEKEIVVQAPADINYTLIKIINLSSLPLILLPPLNILLPLFLMFKLKQKNTLARQIISVQIVWTIMAPVVFMLGIFLKLGRQFTLVLIILIVLSNIFIILRNAAAIDKHKKLYYKLNFSII